MTSLYHAPKYLHQARDARIVRYPGWRSVLTTARNDRGTRFDLARLYRAYRDADTYRKAYIQTSMAFNAWVSAQHMFWVRRGMVTTSGFYLAYTQYGVSYAYPRDEPPFALWSPQPPPMAEIVTAEGAVRG